MRVLGWSARATATYYITRYTVLMATRQQQTLHPEQESGRTADDPKELRRGELANVLRQALDEAAETRATSVRLPATLHDAAQQLVASGTAGSVTSLLVDGLRNQLRLVARAGLHDEDAADAAAALNDHYSAVPDDRPSLEMVVLAEAEMQRHPAAERPDLISAAVAELGDDAYLEELLAWVAGAICGERRFESAVAS